MDHRIKLRHLRCFLETARLGSLSAAAQAMHVSQPAASKTIKELEQIIGKPLFDRTSRRLSLTSEGRIFQQHTGAAMIELTRAQDLIQGNRPSARLSVGALPTAATELMPRAAIAFRETHPNCMLRVSTGPNWLLMSQLREGALDLVIGRMAAAKVMDGLSFRQLFSEQIAAIIRPDHPLTRVSDAVAHLSEFPLILPPPGAVISPLVRAFLARQSISPHMGAMETVSLAFGRRVVQSSDAIWFISRGVVADELAARTLATLPLGQELLGSPVGISMREEGAMTEHQRQMIAALTRSAATMQAP